MSGIRYRIVSKYLGSVLLVMAAVFSITAASAYLFIETPIFYFCLISAVMLSAIGYFLIKRVPEKEVTRSEAAAIAASSFLLASIVGSVPFLFFTGSTLLNAWFEAMSGVTTTGFSLLIPETIPKSMVFYRALLQWVGGLGFVVITATVFIISGRPAVTLLKDSIEEKVFPRITKNMQAIAVIYLLFTVVGFLLLKLFGVATFDSICFALAGLSTGGFSPVSDITAIYSAWQIFIPLIFVMFAGSTNMIAYYKEWKERKSVLQAAYSIITNPQFLTLSCVLAISGFLFAIVYGGKHRVIEGIFFAVSAHTTTGFALSPPTAFPPGALMLAVLLMFIGGSAGSTAGGIKILRLIELYKSLKGFLLSQIYLKERVIPEDAGEKESKNGLSTAIYVITLYALAIAISAVIFTLSGYPPLESIFEVTSAASTVGLSSGIVSYELASPLKLILIFLMLGGRLEFIALLIWGAATITKK